LKSQLVYVAYLLGNSTPLSNEKTRTQNIVHIFLKLFLFNS